MPRRQKYRTKTQEDPKKHAENNLLNILFDTFIFPAVERSGMTEWWKMEIAEFAKTNL